MQKSSGKKFIGLISIIYFVAVLLGVLITSPTQACACGMLVAQRNKSIAMESEQGVVVFDGSTQTEQMAIDFQLSGSSDNSALIVPTPVKSDISQIKKAVFDDLWDIVHPPSDSFSLGSSKGTPNAVEVLERKIVGSFEIAVLKTNSYSDLTAWTTNNGFFLEPEAEGPVQAYIDKGFVLNVIKLKKDAVDSNINPLLFTFQTSKYFYPLMEIEDSRNDLKDKSLMLYLITDEKVTGLDAQIENQEISKSELDDEITKTDESDFSNLNFTSDKYFITYLRSNDYSAELDLGQVLGNSTKSSEFAATKDVKKETETPIVPIWTYIAIGMIVIATAGVVVYFFWKKKQLAQATIPANPTGPTDTTSADVAEASETSGIIETPKVTEPTESVETSEVTESTDSNVPAESIDSIEQPDTSNDSQE